MIAATIVARNYLAQARVLAASFLQHHPGARFVTLVIDGDASDLEPANARQRIVLPGDLGLVPGEWEQMAGLYSLMEFATALKPALLRFLLLEEAADARAPGSVLYLDPDIVVFQPFPEVFSVAHRAGIALTPHVLHALPRDGLEPDEAELMHAGLFNLGFICVGQGAMPFLEWWHERLRVDAVVDLDNALFTDQRWVDWVPTLFGAEVLRDHGLNVAYWNLHERALTRGDNGSILAAGDPLKFFHFSGYDPERPWQLSKHAAHRPRAPLYEHALVAQLCNEYTEALLASGYHEHAHSAYGLEAAPNGVRLAPLVRATYRAGIKASTATGTAVPPAPFAADGGAAFAEWLMAPDIGPRELELSALHLELWRTRPDLQVAFPDPGGLDAERYREWLDADPWARQLPSELCLPARRASGADHDDHIGPLRAATAGERISYGWNVIGYFSAENGVGEAGRRMNVAIEQAGIATQLVAVAAPTSRQWHRLRRDIRERVRYQDSLYCVNADALEGAVAVTEGPTGATRASKRGRRIGLWFWEVEAFPDRWDATYDLLDEIWCASEFTADVIGRVAPIPVHVVPLPVWAPSAPTPFSRQQLGLPEGFVFLFSFDFNSIFERKNPLGLIEAYTRAIGPHDGATLVIKSTNGAQHLDQRQRLGDAAAGRADIVLLEDYLDAHRMQGLIEHCDCFVSLHRSEGFGLQMATAMALRRPVIATGYSGNMTYMDAESALLVPYELVPIGPGNDPYPASASWAAPDLDVAAERMRAVFDDPAMASAIAERGRAAVLDRQGLGRASLAVGDRLAPDIAGVASASVA